MPHSGKLLARVSVLKSVPLHWVRFGSHPINGKCHRTQRCSPINNMVSGSLLWVREINSPAEPADESAHPSLAPRDAGKGARSPSAPREALIWRLSTHRPLSGSCRPVRHPFSHCTDEETEARIVPVACPRLHTWSAAGLHKAPHR